jgi:aminopeptidase N
MTDYSYSKGMLFFYILYHTVGEKAFFDAIKGYYDEFKDTGSTTMELLTLLRQKVKHKKLTFVEYEKTKNTLRQGI